MMNRDRILPAIGFGLLIVCFSIALTRVLGRHRTDADASVTVVRIAHWQLESGLREAIDQLAREYERLNPGVRIEQNPIPEKVYPSWFRTQLVGGTAPDIVQIGKGSDDEMLARFFMPLTAEVDEPNPHNAGTSLEGLPWRETFIDGLAGGESYKPNLLEYYGVPLSMFTVRMYYNATAWKRILGDTPPPADYDSFIAVCERVREHSRVTGMHILPIAGSSYGTPWFATALVGAQTQRLARTLDDNLVLKPNVADTALQFLSGRWSLGEVAFADGLELAREIGRFAQPGFLQASRDDASFYFMQERALMIVTGSWDAPSFRALAPFEIGAFRLPMPDAAHPRHGRGVIGPSSEADTPTGSTFGLTRFAKNPDAALDFLRFLTSQAGNAEFSRISNWLPSVVGVDLPEIVHPFAPEVDGYPGGIGLEIGSGADVRRLIYANLGTLFDANAGAGRFLEIIAAEMPRAVRSDLVRSTANLRNNISRQDTLIAAQIALLELNAGDAEVMRKRSELYEAQTLQEMRRAWNLRELASPTGERVSAR